MKKGIHPVLHPVVFIDSSNGTEFKTFSTMTSEEKKKIDGVEHYIIRVDISSASHPFYTGEKVLIDAAGRVDKFKAREAAGKKLQDQHLKAQEKKLKKETVEEKVTRKAKENTEAKEAEKVKKEVKKPIIKKTSVDKDKEVKKEDKATKKSAPKKAVNKK